MKAYFLGAKLHGQQLEDPGTETYRHKHSGIPKKSIGRAWTVSTPDQVDTYYRHETEPVYRLEGYVPTPEDLEEVRGWLGYC